MVEIRLTATRLVADGDQLYSIASALRTGIASADGTLSGFGGMAGNDNLGEALAEGYDSRAEIYLRNAHAIMANVGALDGILCATAAAYDDVQSFGSGGSGSTIVVPSFSEGAQPSLPSALGGSWEGNFGPIDLGLAQEAIEDALTALGLAYPNANVDQLTAAANAFSLLEADLRRASSSLSSALSAASSMDLPQWPTIDGTRNDLVRLLDERVDECVEMQNFINGALGQIDHAKQEFALNLGQLVLEIALDLGITAALTAVTGPLGAALGSVKIVATIAKWVNRIRESILAARIAIIALREALKGAAVSAASAAGASVVFDGMVRGQWDRVGVAALSSAAGGFVGGPISHALSGGSRGIIRNALAGGGSGVFDGAASELVASSMENRDFNLLAGAGMGFLTGTVGGGATQAVTNALPSRGNVGGNVATPQVQAGTNNGRPQPVSVGGNRPGADAPGNAPQPGPAPAAAAAAAAGGAAPRTDANAPQPGAGTGGGGSQPAAGGAPPIDSSAPQPGVGGDGPAQAGGSGAPDVPTAPAGGDAPTAPAAEAPAAPSTEAPMAPAAEAPAAPAAEAPTAPSAEAPTAPPADAPAPPSADAPTAPPADAPTAGAPAPAADAPATEAPTADQPVAEAPASENPASDAPTSDVPPADGTSPDASGIPVVDLPNLPDALPIDAPASTPDGAAQAEAGGPTAAGAVAAGLSGAKAPDAGGFSPDDFAPVDAGATPDAPTAESDAPAAPDAEAPTGAGAPEGDVPTSDAADDAAPNVPPHSGLTAPPLHQAADAPQLPRTELDALNAQYRLPSGEIDPARLGDWAEAVSAAYPGLRPQDVLGIYDYTTNAGYLMNDYLRGGASTPVDASLETRIDAATQGLANLPAEPSYGSPAARPDTFFHRGVGLNESFLAQFQVGERWSDAGFMSATNDVSVANRFVQNEVTPDKEPGIITIDGLTPAEIAPLSRYVKESEFLFQRGTEFEVVSKMQDADGVWRIHLRELERLVR